MMTAPLSGLRVLELGRVLAAPLCAQILGDLGADVIKVERPQGGDESRAYGPPFPVDDPGQSYYYLGLNRSKRSIALDLKRPEGLEVLKRLTQRTDVFLHNWSGPAIRRLGFGEADVKRINPRAIYCGISGFGPEDDRPALDMLAQAASGLMSITGPQGGQPVRAGVPISDLAAGLYAAIGILAALEDRHHTGEGQAVSTSLLSASLGLLTYQASRYFMTGEDPARLGNAHPSIVPYDSYPTRDGSVVITVANDPAFQRLCGALDLPELGRDPRFATNPDRVRNRAELEPQLRKATAALSSQELVARCEAVRVPCGEVKGLAEVLGGMKDLPFPVRMGKESTPAPRPPPRLGEHTWEVLAELGYGVSAPPGGPGSPSPSPRPAGRP